MRGFFPDDAVEYFVSYYDYYQPEAYIPSTDTYIEKDSAINDEIDRLRHSATAALSERRNVIIVASVSCIYSLGDPIDYRSMVTVSYTHLGTQNGAVKPFRQGGVQAGSMHALLFQGGNLVLHQGNQR